jgi:hypothetical protein
MTQIPHVNNNPKPITSLIVPRVSTVMQSIEVKKLPIGNQSVITLPQQIPTVVQPIEVQKIPIGNQNVMALPPVPISGIIVESPISQNLDNKNITEEDRKQLRLQKLRESQSKYRDKTKPYIRIASIPGERCQVMELLKLHYPQLEQVPSYVLEAEIDEFIKYVIRERQ